MLAGALVLTGLAAWRLSQDEPIRLTFLTPYLEEALTPKDGSFKVAIDDTVLSWGGWERTLDLRATQVRVIEQDGRTIAAIPGLSLTLSLRALLIHQLVAPTAIEIFEPRIFLIRDESGQFRFVHAAQDDPSRAGDETSPVLERLLATLLAPPDPSLPTGYLTSANVTRGQLTFVDRKAGVTWRAPVANIALRRDAQGIAGRLDLAIERLGEPARLDASVIYDSKARGLKLIANLDGVKAAALAEIDPVLARFRGADLVLRGRLSSTIGLDGRIGSSEFELSGGPGSWSMPGTLAEPLKITGLTLAAAYDPATDRLTVANTALQLDGPRLTLAGTVDGVHAGAGASSDMRIAGKVTVEQVSFADLPRYWPVKVRPNPREWIATHVTDGVAERTEAEFALTLPGGDPSAAEIEQLVGTVEGTGITVHYLDPLPPVEGVAGVAQITQAGFTADISAGHVGGVEVDSGKLQISGFQEPDQIIDVEGKLRGSLSEALTILDNPRLGYAKKLGITPEGAAGDTTATLAFTFPAKKGLSFDQVKVAATAEIKGAAVDKAMLGQPLSDGDISLELDREAMAMQGTAKFGGAPIKFRWDENFGKADYIRKITASGIVSAEQRAAMGFDYRPMIDGPVDGTVEYTRLPKKRARVDLKLKLEQATLQLPVVDWEKPKGTPGDAYVVLDLADERLRDIPEFSLVAGDLVASGNARFDDEDGTPNRVEFGQLKLKKTDLKDVAVSFAGERVDAVIGGGDIDAEALIKRDQSKTETDDLPPFSLRADRLRRVYLAEGRSLSDVSVKMRHDGEHWDEFVVDATLPEDKPLAVRYEPVAGQHKLSITSPDAGATLRAFGVFDTVKGGRLSITGTSDDAAPARPISGTMEIDEFRVVGASVLVRLLNAATLFGLVDMLTGDGFQFDRFESDFRKTAGRVNFKLARMHGPSIGITGAGYLDFDKDALNVEGTVVPAYALNSIINEIPIIGFILTGGEGQGFLGVTYEATGSLEKPSITPNPLSALTPGFLRGIFSITDGDGEAPPPITALPKSGTNK